MVLPVHLVKRALLGLLECLEMMVLQVNLVEMESQEDVLLYQVNDFHLVTVEMQESR